MREISKSTRAKAEPKIKREREREKGADGYRDEFFFLSSKEKTGPLSSLERAAKGNDKKKDSVRESREDLAGFTRALLTKTICIYIYSAGSVVLY